MRKITNIITVIILLEKKKILLYMNNEQYISVAYSQIPYDTQVKTIRAEYKISAKLDDIIVPYVVHENDVWTVELRNLENKLYAIVQFL